MANNQQRLGQYVPVSAILGADIYTGEGAPTFSAAQGSLYLNKTGSSTTTRLYINTDGSTTWANFTASA